MRACQCSRADSSTSDATEKDSPYSISQATKSPTSTSRAPAQIQPCCSFVRARPSAMSGGTISTGQWRCTARRSPVYCRQKRNQAVGTTTTPGYWTFAARNLPSRSLNSVPRTCPADHQVTAIIRITSDEPPGAFRCRQRCGMSATAIHMAIRLGSAKGVNWSAKRASCPICALISIMPRPSRLRIRVPEACELVRPFGGVQTAWPEARRGPHVMIARR